MSEILPNIRWNPPCPSSSLIETEKRGQKLLALVRVIENEESCAPKVDEAITLFGDLIALCSMRGLLQGDTQKAEQILSSRGNPLLGGASNSAGRLKNKRGRRKEGSKMDKEATATVAVDENLLFSAVMRTLGMKYNSHLVTMAANLSTAICLSISQSKILFSTVALAEYELLVDSGMSILAGLSRVSNYILSNVMGQHIGESSDILIFLREIVLDDQSDDFTALVSCLRASALLICMFGTKLSRNTSLLADCRTVAWSALTVPDDTVQCAAAKLIAALPLAGGITGDSTTNTRTPADIWANGLMDSIVALSRILSETAPVRQLTFPLKVDSWVLSHHADRTLSGLRSVLQASSGRTEEFRAAMVRTVLKAFTRLIVSFLERDYHGPGNHADLLDARISFDHILNLLEKMLSYPAAAESTFYLTKRRLRFELLEGGLISPNALASEVASHIKQNGHWIFNVLLSSVGAPALLPYGRRMLRMSCAALLSSVSGPLRKVVDPTSSALQFEGKKRRWLHTSISLRAVAVRSFSSVVLAFGLGAGRSSASRGTSQGANEFDRFISLVGGCLLEQISWNGSVNQETDDWGGLPERVDLAIASAQSLQSLLLSYGGFLPLKARSLVDSITLSGLKKIAAVNKYLIFGMSAVKIALLRLGCACLLTPWTDGSLSPILEHLRMAATACNTGEPDVVAVAMVALRLCDSLNTPRVPPLHCVTRTTSSDFGEIRTLGAPSTAEALLEDLQNAESDIVKVSRAVDQSTSDEIVSSSNKLQEEQKSKRKRAEKQGDSKEKSRDLTASQESPAPRSSAVQIEPQHPSLTAFAANSVNQGGDNQKEAVQLEAVSKPLNRKSTEVYVVVPAQPNPMDENEEDEDFMPGIVDDGPDEGDM